VLLRSGQDALEPHDEQVADQVGANVLGPATHEFERKTRNPFANGRFDLALRFVGHNGGFSAVIAALSPQTI
jgi:hypothetical protein